MDIEEYYSQDVLHNSNGSNEDHLTALHRFSVNSNTSSLTGLSVFQDDMFSLNLATHQDLPSSSSHTLFDVKKEDMQFDGRLGERRVYEDTGLDMDIETSYGYQDEGNSATNLLMSPPLKKRNAAQRISRDLFSLSSLDGLLGGSGDLSGRSLGLLPYVHHQQQQQHVESKQDDFPSFQEDERDNFHRDDQEMQRQFTFALAARLSAFDNDFVETNPPQPPRPPMDFTGRFDNNEDLERRGDEDEWTTVDEPRLGNYNVEERAQRLEAFRDSRKKRVYNQVLYSLRQASESKARDKTRGMNRSDTASSSEYQRVASSSGSNAAASAKKIAAPGLSRSPLRTESTPHVESPLTVTARRTGAQHEQGTATVPLVSPCDVSQQEPTVMRTSLMHDALFDLRQSPSSPYPPTKIEDRLSPSSRDPEHLEGPAAKRRRGSMLSMFRQFARRLKTPFRPSSPTKQLGLELNSLEQDDSKTTMEEEENMMREIPLPTRRYTVSSVNQARQLLEARMASTSMDPSAPGSLHAWQQTSGRSASLHQLTSPQPLNISVSSLPVGSSNDSMRPRTLPPAHRRVSWFFSSTNNNGAPMTPLTANAGFSASSLPTYSPVAQGTPTNTSV